MCFTLTKINWITLLITLICRIVWIEFGKRWILWICKNIILCKIKKRAKTNLILLLYLANYLMAQTVMKVAKELNQEMRDIYFSYYSIMNGIVTPPERWQTCTAAASGERELTDVLKIFLCHLWVHFEAKIKVKQQYSNTFSE